MQRKIEGDYIVTTYPNGAIVKELRFAPEPAPMPTPEPRHISVGAFFDRFGAQKYPILASHELMVQALIKDCTVRSYIDLDRADLPGGLQMLVQAGFTIDPEAVLTAPILDNERP